MPRRRRETGPRLPAEMRLVYEPNLGMATEVCRCLLAFCEPFVLNEGVLARLRVAIQELIENTALYASDGVTDVRVAIAERSGDTSVSVETTNRADAEDIERLEASIAEIDRTDDLQAHYQQLMRRVVGGEHLPGLGLGRIAAEPGLALRWARDGDRVTVTVHHAPRPSAPRAELDLPAVALANLSAAAVSVEGVVTLTLQGIADEASHATVASLIDRLHEEAVRTGAERVVVDVRKLEFMSSSCIKALVSWVAKLQEHERGYPVFFLHDPTTHWQARSLEPLRRLAPDVVSLGT